MTERTGFRLDKRGWIIVGLTLAVGAGFFAAFYVLVTPTMYRSTDPSLPFGFVVVPDDDEYVGHAHLVTGSFWSHTSAPVTSVTMYYYGAHQPTLRAVSMQRIGQGDSWAGELPALGAGERYFYYFTARDGAGSTVNVPSNAPEKPLIDVRWENRIDLLVLTLHITLMIGATFFLVHSVYYALLMLTSASDGVGVPRKAHRAMRWGWLAFFIGGVPLGIYVSGAALGWQNAWGGWPLGVDLTDTKTEVLVVSWAIALLARPDLWREGGLGVPWRSVKNRSFAVLILVGALLTVLVYAIPHSYFFQ